MERLDHVNNLKNCCIIIYPELLDIKKFYHGDFCFNRKTSYILFAAINHQDLENTRHYHSYIRFKESYWYEFNDFKVQKLG